MAVYRFIYPDYGVDPYPGDPMAAQRQNNGKLVQIVRHMRDEYEWMGDAMFMVREEETGAEFAAWHSELHSPEYPWPSPVDQNGNAVSPL